MRYKEFLEPWLVCPSAKALLPCYDLTYLRVEFKFPWYPGWCHPNPYTIQHAFLRQENERAAYVIRLAHWEPHCQPQVLYP